MFALLMGLPIFGMAGGSYYGGGLSADCMRLGCLHGHCDFDFEVDRLTEACIGIQDNTCMHTLCNLRSDCDFWGRFRRYTNLCAGRDPNDGLESEEDNGPLLNSTARNPE